MPSFDAMVSEITAPTKASVMATFSEAKKYGIVRGRPTLRRMSSLRRAERAQHVLQFGLDGREAGRHVHRDREERQHERGGDRRRLADAHPEHQDRHDRRLRHGIDADEQRIEPLIGQPRRPDDDAEQHADHDAEANPIIVLTSVNSACSMIGSRYCMNAS